MARFFLSSIGLLSSIASRSVTELGVIRLPTLAVVAKDSTLLHTAMASHNVVAIVPSLSPHYCLVGKISPSNLCS